MNRAAAILALLFVSCPVLAEGPPALSTEEEQQGFHLLFNGKDLTGFKEVQGLPGAFKVVDSVIEGKRGGPKAYWLSTTEKYGDFELRLDYMLEPDGNSGIFIRVPDHIGRTSSRGMEIQLQDDTHRKGAPTEKDTCSIYRVAAATKFVPNPPNQWNSLTIVCRGDRIQVTHNGEPVQDFDMAQHEATKNRPREGYIGLSAHTDTVRFRNVRIKGEPKATHPTKPS